MFLFAFWKDYTVSASGDADKQVECEDCGSIYQYTIHRKIVAWARSWYFLANRWAEKTADKRTKQKLKEALSNGVEDVPCPMCGHYQEDMIWPARNKMYRRIGPTATAIAIALPIIWFASLFFTSHETQSMTGWLCTAGATLSGLAAAALPAIVRSTYDPNAESAKKRIRRGKKRARLIAAGVRPEEETGESDDFPG